MTTEGGYNIKVTPIGGNWRYCDNLLVEISLSINGKKKKYHGVVEAVP